MEALLEQSAVRSRELSQPAPLALPAWLLSLRLRSRNEEKELRATTLAAWRE
jgi:hypothetical protein